MALRSPRPRPAEWLKVILSADYTRRGFYNRGDYWRQSYKNPGDTTLPAPPLRIPGARLGHDSRPGHADRGSGQDSCDSAPASKSGALRDLFLSGSVSFWTSENYQGAIGLNKNGLDFALKVEYRY